MLTGVLVALAGAVVAGPAPERVVSVNIMSDEILLAMIPERLAAVSVLADEPEVSNVVREAARVPVRVKADPERIVALRPELVVIGGQSFHVADRLEALGVRVVRIQGFESFGWIERVIWTLGEAVHERSRAEALIAAMRERVAAVGTRVEGRRRPRVLVYSIGGATAGRGTIFDDVIRAAGGENLAAARGLSGWKRLSLEQLVATDPEVIVVTASRRWAVGFHAEFLEHPALQTVRAFRDGRVYQLPGRLMITTSHHIAETVEALASLLHPGAIPWSGR